MRFVSKSIVYATFFVFIFASIVLAEQETIQLNISQNNIFSVSPPESDADGEWIINTYDRTKLELIENGERLGKKYFVFNPKKSGKASIYLEFVRDQRSLEKLTYEVIISASQEGSGSADNAVSSEEISPAEISNTNNIGDTKQEQTMYQLINKLYERKLYDEALNYINKYEQQFSMVDFPNKQEHLTDILYKKAEIILQTNDLNNLNDQERQQALQTINSLIQDRKNLLNSAENTMDFTIQTAVLMYQLAQIQEKLKKWNDARTTYVKLLTFFEPGKDPKIDKIFLKARLGLAKTYYHEQNYEAAFQEFNEIADTFIPITPEKMYEHTVYIHARHELEEILYFLARLYCIRGPYADYNKAFRIYSILSSDEYFPGGRYQIAAQEKVNYLKTNFLDYR